jgi:hypothetical protein
MEIVRTSSKKKIWEIKKIGFRVRQKSQKFRESHGNLENPMGVLGIRSESRESHGNPENPMEISGIRSESRESWEYEIRRFPFVSILFPFLLVRGEMDEASYLVFYSFLLEKIDIS